VAPVEERAAAPVCASALAKFFCARLKDNGRGSRARHGHGRARMGRAQSDGDMRGRVGVRRARDQVSVGRWPGEASGAGGGDRCLPWSGYGWGGGAETAAAKKACV
jgi:hypothetical protein